MVLAQSGRGREAILAVGSAVNMLPTATPNGSGGGPGRAFCCRRDFLGVALAAVGHGPLHRDADREIPERRIEHIRPSPEIW
jgi:hypothetical protein